MYGGLLADIQLCQENKKEKKQRHKKSLFFFISFFLSILLIYNMKTKQKNREELFKELCLFSYSEAAK
jgi:uncharacterized membrane protein